MKETIQRYKNILEEMQTSFPKNQYLSYTHLTWMLDEISKGEMPWPKACRWLGYVQGILTYMGFINVSEERDITREFLPALDTELENKLADWLIHLIEGDTHLMNEIDEWLMPHDKRRGIL